MLDGTSGQPASPGVAAPASPAATSINAVAATGTPRRSPPLRAKNAAGGNAASQRQQQQPAASDLQRSSSPSAASDTLLQSFTAARAQTAMLQQQQQQQPQQQWYDPATAMAMQQYAAAIAALQTQQQNDGTISEQQQQMAAAMYQLMAQQQQQQAAANPQAAYFAAQQQHFLAAQAQAQLQLQAQAAAQAQLAAMVQQQGANTTSAQSNAQVQAGAATQVQLQQQQQQQQMQLQYQQAWLEAQALAQLQVDPRYHSAPTGGQAGKAQHYNTHYSQQHRTHNSNNSYGSQHSSPQQSSVQRHHHRIGSNSYAGRHSPQLLGNAYSGAGGHSPQLSGATGSASGSPGVSPHPTPLAIQPFIGGPGSVLLVENLDPIPLPPASAGTSADGKYPLVQLSPDHLFTIFGVYGDVVRVKLASAAAIAALRPQQQGLSQTSSPATPLSAPVSLPNSNAPSQAGTPSVGSMQSSRASRAFDFSASPTPTPTTAGGVSEATSPQLDTHPSSLSLGMSVLSSDSEFHSGSVSASSGTASPPAPNTSSALIQFMSREQAQLALAHLDGQRVLGPASNPMKLSVSSLASIPSPVRVSAANAAHDAGTVKDYQNHAGHRFKYISSKNSRHICAPCAALHLSGLSPEVSEDDLRTFFTAVFARALATPAQGAQSHILSLSLFGSDGKRMAFLVLRDRETAIVALVFGHNVKLKGKYMRMTFSHAKEHQMTTTMQQPHSGLTISPRGGVVPLTVHHQTASVSMRNSPPLGYANQIAAGAGASGAFYPAGVYTGPTTSIPGALPANSPEMLLALQAQMAGLGMLETQYAMPPMLTAQMMGFAPAPIYPPQQQGEYAKLETAAASAEVPAVNKQPPASPTATGRSTVSPKS